MAYWSEEPSLSDGSALGEGWPKFLFLDPVAQRLMPRVEHLFAEFRVVFVEGEEVVAGGWGVPLRWSGDVADLPRGWDEALEISAAAVDRDDPPDTLCVAAEVVGHARGRGLSSEVLRTLRDRAVERGLSRVIAPARPTLKHRYPLVPIARYAGWMTSEGLPFGPWIRVHVRVGGRLLTTTDEGMRIVASVAEWEEATGMAFPKTDDYVVPEALGLVRIDREGDIGTYSEPAIWIQHRSR